MIFSELLIEKMKSFAEAEIIWSRGLESKIILKTKNTQIILTGKKMGERTFFHVEILTEGFEIQSGVVEIIAGAMYKAHERVHVGRTKITNIIDCENKRKLMCMIEFGDWVYSQEKNLYVEFERIGIEQMNKILNLFLQRDLSFYQNKILIPLKEKYIENAQFSPQKPYCFERKNGKYRIVPRLKKSMLGDKVIHFEDFRTNENLYELIKKDVLEPQGIGDRERLKRLFVYLAIAYELHLQLGHETATKIIKKEEIINSFYLTTAKNIVREIINREYIDEVLNSIGIVERSLSKEGLSMRKTEYKTENKVKLNIE